jgi:ABC-type sugar transport system ATPase subunit
MSVSVERIRKAFRGKNVLNEVSLEVADGEFTVLLGPSGCGKSTLLRVIAGLETPDSGSIRISGRDATMLEPRDRDVAMVFQSYALYPHMTAAANIGYPLKIRKTPADEAARSVAEVAERLGLTRLLESYPRQLSGGERQRVALARAMVRRPKLFLMDEPLSNLDAQLRANMRGELKHLQHELKTATIYVTHDQAEAMTLAHRIAVMSGGRILQYGTPSQIYNRPANRFVATFVGSPPMNVLEQPDGTALAIRPEHVEVETREAPGWLPAKVWVSEELGSETLVQLKTDSLQLVTARVKPDLELSFDQAVWYRFREDRLLTLPREQGETPETHLSK